MAAIAKFISVFESSSDICLEFFQPTSTELTQAAQLVFLQSGVWTFLAGGPDGDSPTP
jgi:hypothetical protein